MGTSVILPTGKPMLVRLPVPTPVDVGAMVLPFKRKRGRKPKSSSTSTEAAIQPLPPLKKARLEAATWEAQARQTETTEVAQTIVSKAVSVVTAMTAPVTAAITTVQPVVEARSESTVQSPPPASQPEDRLPKVNLKFYKQRSISRDVLAEKGKKKEEPRVLVSQPQQQPLPLLSAAKEQARIESQPSSQWASDGNKVKPVIVMRAPATESAVAVPDSSSSPSQPDQGRIVESHASSEGD